MGGVGEDGVAVGSSRDGVTCDHGDGHVFAKVFDDSSETVEAGGVENGTGDEGDVERGERVTLVHQGLVSERRNRQTFLHITGHEDSQQELEDHQATVASKGTLGGESMVANMSTHSLEEGPNVIDRVRDDELAIVEPEADPEVVHEQREQCHQGSDTPWTAKLPVGVLIELLVGLATLFGDDDTGRLFGKGLLLASTYDLIVIEVDVKVGVLRDIIVLLVIKVLIFNSGTLAVGVAIGVTVGVMTVRSFGVAVGSSSGLCGCAAGSKTSRVGHVAATTMSVDATESEEGAPDGWRIGLRWRRRKKGRAEAE